MSFNLDLFIQKIRPKNRILLDDLHIPEGVIFQSPHDHKVFYQAAFQYILPVIRDITHGHFDRIMKHEGQSNYNVRRYETYLKDIKPIARRVHFIYNVGGS